MPQPVSARRSQAAGRVKPQELKEVPPDLWDQAWDAWIASKTVDGRAAKTLGDYSWGRTWIEEFRLDEANRITTPPAWTATHTTEFIGWLREAELGAWSLEKIVNGCLVQFLSWCADDEREEGLAWRITTRKPSSRHFSDNQPKRDAYPKLNQKEMRVALDQAKTDRDRFLLMFLACTGARIGEVGARSQGDEANLTLDAFEVNQTSGELELVIWRVKPPREQRRVPVDPRLKKLLDWYLKEVRPKGEDVAINRETGSPWQALFLSDRLYGGVRAQRGQKAIMGKHIPMTVSGLQQIIKDIQHGSPPIPRMHPHIFRHTFGRAMAHLVMPQVLMNLLGHKDIRTTLIYCSLESISSDFRPQDQMAFQWLDEEVAKLRSGPRRHRAIAARRRRAVAQP